MKKTKMVPALLLAVAAATLNARPAAGQELFQWPDTAVDVSTYMTVYECMAAVARVRHNVGVHEYRTTHIDRDTMAYDADVESRPLPPVVGETARTCLASVESTDSVPEDAWEALAQLYLHAGWEDSARVVVERRLAAVEPGSADELKDLFSKILSMYHGRGNPASLKIQPSRIELGDDIVLDHVGELKDIKDRLNVYLQMLITGGTHLTEDSEAGARTRRLLTRIKAQVDSLSHSDLQRLADASDDLSMKPEEVSERLEGLAMYFFGRKLFLDSLRVSTAAYAKAVRETFSQATGQPPEAYLHGRPLGERAPRLEGDIWLGCEKEPCEPYPRPGRVSLVVFNRREGLRDREVTTPGLFSPRVGCDQPFVRRLMERFPELDVTIVTRTTGRYAYVKEDGTTPEREAELMRKCLDSVGLDRAVLTMTETPGWRLPEPDGRRVNRETSNWTNYSFDGSWSDPDRIQQGRALLIDQDGYIVHTGNVDWWQVMEFAELIELLLEREGPAT